MNNLEKLMQNLPEEFDAALITSAINRRYYTGFASSAGTVVVMRDKSYFIIDSRYYEAASATVKNAEVVLQDKLYPQIAELLEKHNAKTVGIEADTVSLTGFAAMKKALPDVTLSADPAVSQQIEQQRQIKSEQELEYIQKAQDNTDKTFAHILNFIKAGKSETEIMLEMEFFSRKHGSEEPAFSFIVAGGKNSSMPHAVPTEYVLQSGDFLTMDFGSTVNGYRSDMTRTIAVGEVSDKQREVYNLVLTAQLESLKAIGPGKVCSDIDKVARDIIDSTQYKGLFGHTLGHSLGLEVHETPRFSTACQDITKPGHVMSVEPGVYLPGEFGVRIEDIVAITEDGYHNFTASPKELLVL